MDKPIRKNREVSLREMREILYKHKVDLRGSFAQFITAKHKNLKDNERAALTEIVGRMIEYAQQR